MIYISVAGTTEESVCALKQNRTVIPLPAQKRMKKPTFGSFLRAVCETPVEPAGPGNSSKATEDS